MNSFPVSAKGPAGTGAVAVALAPRLRPGDIVLLQGGLAAGKTTFVKAVVAALGSAAVVTSPTFTLAQFYPYGQGLNGQRPDGQGQVLHIDAYRLTGIHEFRDLGLDEDFGDSVTLIEWGEKVAEDFPCHLLAEFTTDASDPDRRIITFSSACDRWAPVLADLERNLGGTHAR
jgi:tRNA threonylcarbamoyladenosine biosynthesis protein TsaE